MLHDLSQQSSVLNVYLAEMRDVNVQHDTMRFRKNLERVGRFIAYEISKTFTYNAQEVETPLGIASVPLPSDQVVLATIMRAGLPMHQGMIEVFDHAGNAFVSAYRKHHKDGTFEINLEYVSCPSVDGKIIILSDPMLATGASMVMAAKALMRHGTPKAIHLVSVLAAVDGVEYVRRMLPQAHIWTAAIDEELTARSYIVPGLGDAGDLAFGAKLQE
jgi:uracil phosphoribosyltransferase